MKLASPVNAGDNLWRMTGSLSGLSKSCKATFKDWGAGWRNRKIASTVELVEELAGYLSVDMSKLS